MWGPWQSPRRATHRSRRRWSMWALGKVGRRREGTLASIASVFYMKQEASPASGSNLTSKLLPISVHPWGHPEK